MLEAKTLFLLRFTAMKYFWPIYLSSLVIGTSGVYVAAPLARPYVSGLFAPRAQQPPPAPEAPTRSLPPPVAQAAPAQPAATPPPPHAEEEDSPPALQGIYLAAYGDRPGWGITSQRATYYKLDGSRMGSFPGGVLFDCKDNHKSSKGVMVEGLFFQNGVTNGPFLISRKDVNLFTSSHTKLTPRQREALHTYYALSGNVGTRKNELLQASALKNPHYAEANAAYQAFLAHVEKAQELTAKRDRATELDKSLLEDQLREMKVAETRLKATLEAVNQKFREWKNKHANEIAKPENDPDIKRWSAEMASLRQIVPGLAL